ncbi:hypothetical protein SCAZ3_08335 [Streptococcus canis FSL Z3-227]|uniref:Uncharacterized protein n=1 Tax=Streptococcus canis FSL Z3-227 TaxID=482234 RepID=A0AAV3FTU0_STRCB|nr:hypothetical protein SCAZ3_08335 [Streptococcus canis FSL Z3-227]
MKLSINVNVKCAAVSHPSWVSGLKLSLKISISRPISVSPFMGEWIEIFNKDKAEIDRFVSPFMGEWIEICYFDSTIITCKVSPFMGEWIEILTTTTTTQLPLVSSFMGEWIEIFCFDYILGMSIRLILHG